MTINQFISLILALRMRFSFSVTSWGRTAAHNMAVGGVLDSFHLLWLGMDVVLDPGEIVAEFIKAAKRLGLQVIPEQDHLHIEPDI